MICSSSCFESSPVSPELKLWEVWVVNLFGLADWVAGGGGGGEDGAFIDIELAFADLDDGIGEAVPSVLKKNN